MEEVALAFESEKTCAHIREILEGTGMASCLLCHSGAEVICRQDALCWLWGRGRCWT